MRPLTSNIPLLLNSRPIQQEWSQNELAEYWTLHPDEKELLASKRGAARLGFAVLYKFFQCHARFPRQAGDVPESVLTCIARQLRIPVQHWARYDWQSGTIRRHRSLIRALFDFQEFSRLHHKAIREWLKEAAAQDPHLDRLIQAAYDHCCRLRIEPPLPDQVERLVRSALHRYEKQFCASVLKKLPPETVTQLEALLKPIPLNVTGADQDPILERTPLQDLRAGPGRAGLESLFEEITRLERLRSLSLPEDLFQNIPGKTLRNYSQRIGIEEPYELRRHPTPLRLTLLAVFGYLRQHELTDDLLDLLISVIHRIGAKAERKVERELIQDLKRVTGKHRLLFEMADASLAHPDGIVKEVVYPVVGEQTLQELVKEWKSSGPAYREKIQTIIRNSYKSHYRRMLPSLLKALEFRSNNQRYQPLIESLKLLDKYADTKLRFYPASETVPLDGVVRPVWQDAVVEKDMDETTRINRIAYEICALQTLRERLRCREVWVVGAKRYGNPDEDLPADFIIERDRYYEALKLPTNPQSFIEPIKTQLKEALTGLNQKMPSNTHVKILTKGNGWINLSPLDPQPEPANLIALKTELADRWPMTSLLDIIKETDLRVGFTNVFRSATSHENIGRADLQRRLLLSLYGLGTNTGFKRMGNAAFGVSYRDLLYTRRRFITKDHLRNAIPQIVNATFKIRLPQIWGDGTTACASDSKQFGAWDQNLRTEWHIRYGGRGVMIYWHVERKAVCIYSQLKTCSSSEVAAMIEGLLRHDTDMDLEKNYVDSHGQSEVAFAFCRLLGFQLLPRLKGIHAQKLYQPEAGNSNAFSNLQPVLTRPIDWNLISQQYDQMVKYATALRLGTADTESILRRFTRNNLQHPTYKALAELGKAVKTIFICRYLGSLELRREIHEGLNVIENWNSANSFIFFGKGGEFATNRLEDQEVSMLSLHLLQISLVYINTLMLQRLLTEPAWAKRMTPEDLRALTPLIYNHVNPYGIFKLDMRSRLSIDS